MAYRRCKYSVWRLLLTTATASLAAEGISAQTRTRAVRVPSAPCDSVGRPRNVRCFPSAEAQLNTLPSWFSSARRSGTLTYTLYNLTGTLPLQSVGPVPWSCPHVFLGPETVQNRSQATVCRRNELVAWPPSLPFGGRWSPSAAAAVGVVLRPGELRNGGEITRASASISMEEVIEMRRPLDTLRRVWLVVSQPFPAFADAHALEGSGWSRFRPWTHHIQVYNGDTNRLLETIEVAPPTARNEDDEKWIELTARYPRRPGSGVGIGQTFRVVVHTQGSCATEEWDDAYCGSGLVFGFFAPRARAPQ